jgi:hypothetical protein
MLLNRRVAQISLLRPGMQEIEKKGKMFCFPISENPDMGHTSSEAD